MTRIVDDVASSSPWEFILASWAPYSASFPASPTAPLPLLVRSPKVLGSSAFPPRGQSSPCLRRWPAAMRMSAAWLAKGGFLWADAAGSERFPGERLRSRGRPPAPPRLLRASPYVPHHHLRYVTTFPLPDRQTMTRLVTRAVCSARLAGWLASPSYYGGPPGVVLVDWSRLLPRITL